MDSLLQPQELDLESAKDLSHDATGMMKAGRYETALVLLHNVETRLRKEAGGQVSAIAENVFGNIGACYLNLGQDTKAVKYFEKALSLASGVHQAPVLVNLSFARLRLGDYDQALLGSHKAIRFYESAARSSHDERLHAKAMLIAGMCQEALGHQNKALLTFFKGLCFALERLSPEDDIRKTLNSRYEALQRGQDEEVKATELKRIVSADLSSVSSLSTLQTNSKVRPRVSAHKARPPIKETSAVVPLSKPKPNLFLRLKRPQQLSSRLPGHKKSTISQNFPSDLSSASDSAPDLYSHRKETSELSGSFLIDHSLVEGRIASIGRKLDGLTIKLKEYGTRNRLLEISVGEKSGETTLEKASSPAGPSRPKRNLFKLTPSSHNTKKPIPGTSKPGLKPKYSMYRVS